MRLFPVVLVVAALAVSGCGSSSSSSSSAATSTVQTATVAAGSAALPSAKFVLHAAVAFGVFHHFIYGPLKAGALTNPLSHKLALVKAAGAAAIVLHEIKQAAAAAQEVPSLRKLVAPLTTLGSGIAAALHSAKGGNVSQATLQLGNDAVETIKHEAEAAGAPIKDEKPEWKP